MDPIGPWYVSYNRLVPASSTGTFQAATLNANTDLVTHHLATAVAAQTVPVATSQPQLIIQAAANNIATQPATFNTAGFLSPTPVTYDVFTPLIHTAPKQINYVSQNRPITQAQIVTAAKLNSTIESEIPVIRASYTTPQQTETTFFDNSATGNSTNTPVVQWQQQNSAQLASPFGILPHENITTSTPTSTRANNITYTNSFTPNFTTTVQPANSSISQLNLPVATVEFKAVNYNDAKKTQSPPIKSVATLVTTGQTFLQPGNTTSYNSNNLANNISNENNKSVNNMNFQNQQSCIVSNNSSSQNNTKEYRITDISRSPLVSTLQPNKSSHQNMHRKGFSDLRGNSNKHLSTEQNIPENSQSSPISFCLIDNQNLNYNSNNTSNNCSSNLKQSNGNIQQYHVLNQPQQQTSYKHFSTTSTNDLEYRNSSRSKSVTSTDSAYSSNTSQNGPDCSVVVPRRPSPSHTHSQASPLGPVASPAYPMYNSPMATMSSPSPLQHNDNNSNQCSINSQYKANSQQMTSPSSIDIAVPRSSSQGQTAYSSVITRALGSNDTNRNYDGQQEFNQNLNWNANNQINQRKYPISNYSNNESNVTSLSSQSERILNIPNRQSFYQTETINLQDISSCRGDPTSIAKNVQNVQHTSNLCRVQQNNEIEERNKAEFISKKRRSFEKYTQNSTLTEIGNPQMTDYLNKVPPPAHHNMHQQQNGYFDFDKWTLPAVPVRAFPGSSGIYNSHSMLTNNCGSSFTSAPTASSYFSSFQVSPGSDHMHQNNEYQPNLDIMPMYGYGENSCSSNQSSNFSQEIKDDQPKVIVPNIEEELEFLQQQPLPSIPKPSTQTKTPNNEPNTGFMTSFLKFLQGEVEPPPSPLMGAGKSHTKKNFIRSNISNTETTVNPESVKSPTEPAKAATITDYTNDPRYFPLPKERKKENFESSDEEESSEDEIEFIKKKSHKKSHQISKDKIKSQKIEHKSKKIKPIKSSGTTDKKRKAQIIDLDAEENIKSESKRSKKKSFSVPRRETSRRKAKDQSFHKKSVDKYQGDDLEEEDGDSDSDPAWTPEPKENNDDETKQKKRSKSTVSSKKKKSNNSESYSQQPTGVKKSGKKKRSSIESSNKNNSSKVSCKIDEKMLAAASDDDIDISPFKPGEFVVIKSDLAQEHPPLWRIDGKTLLQKYEPFQSNGKTLHRNISTYSGWAHQNRHIYQQVPIKFWQQGKLETIVEFLRDEIVVDDSEYITKYMKESEKFQDNFEVYIQTLISQALDSNFLNEILQEQDEYFLSNVKTIDDITDKKKETLLLSTNWKQNVINALSTWPCVNILKDLPVIDFKGKLCAGCNEIKIYARVLLYGQPYNSTTLEGSPPDPKVPQEKDFLFCRSCQKNVILFNKVTHQKYIMFLECARRVADKRVADPSKDTTIILNELLANELWLNQLFRTVRSVWAEIDSLENQRNKKANSKGDALLEPASSYSKVSDTLQS